MLAFLSSISVHNNVSAICVKRLVWHCHDSVWDALLSRGVHRLRFEHSWFCLPSKIYVMWSTNMRNQKQSRSTYSSTRLIQKCNIKWFRWNGSWCAHALPFDQTSQEPLSMCTAHHGQTRGPMMVRVDHAFNSPTAQVQLSYKSWDQWYRLVLLWWLVFASEENLATRDIQFTAPHCTMPSICLL